MAHTSKLLDYTTNAFIVKGEKVLLVFNKDYDSWFGPGGHIEQDEDIEQSLFREIYEETGIQKEALTIISPHKTDMPKSVFSDMEGEFISNPSYIDVHKVSPTHRHLAFRYFLVTNEDFKGSSDPSVTKLKWFSLEELENSKYKLKNHVKFYAKEAIKLSNQV